MSRFPAPWEPANIVGQAPVAFAQRPNGLPRTPGAPGAYATGAAGPVAACPPPAARRTEGAA